MKKLFKAIINIITTWYIAECESTETDAEKTDRMAGSNFLL